MPIMRSPWLKSFLFLFTLKSLVTMGNAYPIADLHNEDLFKGNNIMGSASSSVNDTSTSITPYVCVYIPPNLDSCNFGYHKAKESLRIVHTLSEKRIYKFANHNKKNLSHSLKRISETEKLLKQKPVQIIIYEIQKCVPPRLPFVMPWCTEEDLSDKKSEIRRLYPFATKGSSKATIEFPVYNFSS